MEEMLLEQGHVGAGGWGVGVGGQGEGQGKVETLNKDVVSA